MDNKPSKATCKQFCKNVFLPERERVEVEFSKKSNRKYKPIKVLRKTKKALANILESGFLKACDDIYCKKSCKGRKNKWLRSFSKQRRGKLIEQGATSGCRDLLVEYPNDYKNI